MIARTWRGTASASGAADYHCHFAGQVLPHLQDIPGFRGGYLLRREIASEVEFTTVTFWDSKEAIKAFAGADPDVAVVEPEARGVLTSFDAHVVHAEVVCALTIPNVDGHSN
jgi:heme-degrading monooxygenase HmoA